MLIKYNNSLILITNDYQFKIGLFNVLYFYGFYEIVFNYCTTDELVSFSASNQYKKIYFHAIAHNVSVGKDFLKLIYKLRFYDFSSC